MSSIINLVSILIIHLLLSQQQVKQGIQNIQPQNNIINGNGNKLDKNRHKILPTNSLPSTIQNNLSTVNNIKIIIATSKIMNLIRTKNNNSEAGSYKINDNCSSQYIGITHRNLKNVSLNAKSILCATVYQMHQSYIEINSTATSITGTPQLFEEEVTYLDPKLSAATKSYQNINLSPRFCQISLFLK